MLKQHYGVCTVKLLINSEANCLNVLISEEGKKKKHQLLKGTSHFGNYMLEEEKFDRPDK